MSTTNNNEPEPTEKESKMTEAIARDRPTIDAAVKSFISMVCARSMSASATDATAHDKVMMGIIPSMDKSTISDKKETSSDDKGSSSDEDKKDKPKGPSTQQQVLEVARSILKAVNSHNFPVQDTVAYSMAEKPGTTEEKKEELLELSVVSRLWNGLVQSEQKPSKFLGRRALKLAWKQMDIEATLPSKDEETAERQKEWLKQFETLLFATAQPLPSDTAVDDDSALLWAADGGAAELAKRRQRRLDAAKERGPVTPS